MPLLEDIRKIQTTATAELDAAADPEALEAWRIAYLGTKGAVKAAMQRLKDVPRDDKPALGKAANELKIDAATFFEWLNSKCGRWYVDRLSNRSKLSTLVNKAKADIRSMVKEIKAGTWA